MAVALDASASADVTFAGGQTSPFTDTNLTIGGTGTCVIGIVCFSDSVAASLAVPSAMTWNGTSMTLLGHATQSDGQGNCYIYGLANPVTGNHTLSVSFSPTISGTGGGYMDCFSYSGTDLSTAVCFPIANVLTDASTPTGTVYPTTAFSVTTANGDAALSAMMCAAVQFTTMATGTLLRTDGASAGSYTSGYKLAVGAATTLQFGSGGANNVCCGVAIRIQQPQTTLNTGWLVDTFIVPIQHWIREMIRHD